MMETEMAGEIPDLHALERAGTGKGAARAARRDGMVPGIVFGGGTDPLPISVPFNVLLKKLKEGRFKSTLYNLKVDGHDDVRVICRDVQRDVVRDLPTHIDLMRLRRNTKINLFIPVEFLNQDNAPGIKMGGFLNVVRGEIELLVTAGEIPESITIDLDGKEIGDTVTISQVELPEGAKPTISRDFVICNIAAPTTMTAEEEAEEEGEVEGEGEGEAEGAAAEGDGEAKPEEEKKAEE